MSSSATPVDPRLLELLSEVGKQGESVLFDYTAHGAQEATSEQGVRSSEFAVGLSSAERELLRTHRDEAAKLLVEAAVARLCDHSRGRLVYIYAQPDPSSLHARALWHSERGSALTSIDDRSSSVARLLLNASRAQVSVAQLIVSSLRLRERPSARVYLAHDALYRSEPNSALRLAQHIVRNEHAPQILCNAFEVAGAALGDLGRVAEALDCYERAFWIAERARLPTRVTITPALNAVLHALILGKATMVREHAARVRASLVDSRDLINEIVAPYKRGALEGAADMVSLRTGYTRFCRELGDDIAEVVYEAIAV